MGTETKEIIVKQCRYCNWSEPPYDQVPRGFKAQSQIRIESVICPQCRKSKYSEAWRNTAPPYFRETVTAQIPDQVALARAMQWRDGPKGLLLVGETRTGKSRSAWEVIKGFCYANCGEWAQGHHFDRVDGLRLAQLLMSYGGESDSLKTIKSWCNSRLLLLDDIFKAKLTERAEEIIFLVIDERCQQRLPFIITANDSEESLLNRLSSDRGPALLERIKETCDVIAFAKP